MRIEEIDNLFSQLGPMLEPLGISAFPDSKAWGIAVDEEISILVDFDEDQSKLVLNAEIGLPPCEDRSQLYELMLRHGYLWNETGGVRLALDGPEGKVVQIGDISTDGLDLPRLDRAIRLFSESVGAWRAIIHKPPATNITANSDDTALPMIRV